MKSTVRRAGLAALVAFAMLLALDTPQARAQDVPGIEICTAEKTMERRTSCLQSNVDFLKATITKAALENRQRIDAANRQIEALKASVAGLQKIVADMQNAKDVAKDKPKEPAAK